MQDFIAFFRSLPWKKVLSRFRLYLIFFVLFGIYIFFTAPDALGYLMLLLVEGLIAVILFGIGLIALATMASKRFEWFRALFNFVHFTLAIYTLFILFRWKTNPTQGELEPEAAFYGAIVAIMVYLREKLHIAESPHKILEILAAPEKNEGHDHPT